MRTFLIRLMLFVSMLAGTSVAVAQSLGPQQYVTTQDSSTACSNAGTCASFPNIGTISSFAVGVSGTFSGTLTAECLTDPITGWLSMLVSNMATGAQATTITAGGNYTAPNSGCVSIRLRATTWASGTATVTATKGYGVSRLVPVAPAFPATFTAGDLLYASSATAVSGFTLSAHSALVGPRTSIAGGTNCVLYWTSSSSDPTCATAPTLNGLTLDGGNSGTTLLKGDTASGGGFQFASGGLRLYSSTATQGLTSVVPAAQYGMLRALSNTTLGVELVGITNDDSSVGLQLNGITNSTTPGEAVVTIFIEGKNGTIGTALTSGTLFRLQNSVAGVFGISLASSVYTAAMTPANSVFKAPVLNATSTYKINDAVLVSATAPTVSAGFGSTSPGTVTKNTGTLIVVVTVGTNAGGTTGTLTFPAAPTGWGCSAVDSTNPADLTRLTSWTTTTATFTTTVAWTTGDVIVFTGCGPF